MKLKYLLILLVTIFIFWNCKNTEKVSKRRNVTSNLSYNGIIIHDTKTKLTWKFYENNPTSYLRYKVKDDINKVGWELPSYTEVSNFLDQLTNDLNSDSEISTDLIYEFKNELIIFTNSIEREVGEKEKFQAIQWDPVSNSFAKKLVADGNKVYMFLIKR